MSRQQRPHLVIIGHGMGAQRLLQSLSEPFRQRWSITVIGGEPELAYNRIQLSGWLAGDVSPDALTLKEPQWFSDRGYRVHSGDPAIAIDRHQCCVHTQSGLRIGYDRLVLATGSRSAFPELPGIQRSGIQGFRDQADTRQLLEEAQPGNTAVVIGGGFLGLEAADGLRRRGMEVTVLHRSTHLLNRQLDPVAGQLLADTLAARGINIRLESRVAGFDGTDRVRHVALESGETLPADRVVMATGITPNLELAREAGLETDRGIRVDHTLTTSDPLIHALGECCQLADQTYGLVEPVNRQAEVLADRLDGGESLYRDTAVATRLKISGVELFSCGEIAAGPDTESIVYHDRQGGEYRHLLLRNNRLAGAVLYGDTSTGPWLFEHLQQGTDLAPWRAQLAFGEAHCEAA